MATLIIVVILIASVLLVLAVMSQSSKGSGLAGGLGSSAASQIMGAKRTTDFLEKATWGFIAVVLLLSITANIAIDKNPILETSPNIEAAKKKQVAQPKPQGPSLDSLNSLVPDSGILAPKPDSGK
jgi:preprotein translocase subunit SecG